MKTIAFALGACLLFAFSACQDQSLKKPITASTNQQIYGYQEPNAEESFQMEEDESAVHLKMYCINSCSEDPCWINPVQNGEDYDLACACDDCESAFLDPDGNEVIDPLVFDQVNDLELGIDVLEFYADSLYGETDFQIVSVEYISSPSSAGYALLYEVKFNDGTIEPMMLIYPPDIGDVFIDCQGFCDDEFQVPCLERYYPNKGANGAFTCSCGCVVFMAPF